MIVYHEYHDYNHTKLKPVSSRIYIGTHTHKKRE